MTTTADRREPNVPAGQAPRIVDTLDGPALQIPAGVAAMVAASIGRMLAVRPEWRDHGHDAEVVARVRGLLLAVETDAAAGRGFRAETPRPTPEFSWIAAATAAGELGITRQAMTKRLRSGGIPNAHQVAGLGWLVPIDYVRKHR